jgi:G:T-mismatch repair DNA endonuclease (very short patch repair protein)
VNWAIGNPIQCTVLVIHAIFWHHLQCWSQEHPSHMDDMASSHVCSCPEDDDTAASL